MVFARKPQTPIDRAVADLERQIAALEQHVKEVEAGATPRSAKNVAWTKWLVPPSRQRGAVSRRPVPDVPVEPLKELEETPLPFERQPDLFTRLMDKPVKSRAPLRYEQRRNRRRFYLWLGLGMVVLGLLWLVMR